jgi:hypothetical protein
MFVMFYVATAFNQSIGSWNVVSVKNMNSMFRGAPAFGQNLCPWSGKVVTNVQVGNMFP